MAKKRLDILLVERGLAESCTQAQALIMQGAVYHGEQRLDKPGHSVPDDLEITLRQETMPWVSRGGLKLAHGLEHFQIDPKGMVALDVGASTGGFTDVLLQGGAVRVHAVDVGHGQLDWKLRNDQRVVVHEKTNARYLTSEMIPDIIDLIVCDASFISLKTILPAALALAAPKATLIALIKPQFEVGKGKVGKGGVVRDEALHQHVCEEITGWLNWQEGWNVVGVTESPVHGPAGNKEFLVCAKHAE